MAGTRLKARAPDWDGTNNFGFSALPGGYRYATGGFNYDAGSGYWWSATESGSGGAYSRGMYSHNAYVYEGIYDEGYGFSARCVR